MDKKKIKKFVEAMDKDGCAVIVAVGSKGVAEKRASRSFGVIGKFDDVATLLGYQLLDLINIFSRQMGEDGARAVLYGLLDTAFEEHKKGRQPGMADDPKGE